MLKIDLHGQTEAEAQVNLQTFLVECEIKKAKVASVSHGYGEQILQKMTHRILKENSHVKKYYFAHPNDGGAGITIIEFEN